MQVLTHTKTLIKRKPITMVTAAPYFYSTKYNNSIQLWGLSLFYGVRPFNNKKLLKPPPLSCGNPKENKKDLGSLQNRHEKKNSPRKGNPFPN